MTTVNIEQAASRLQALVDAAVHGEDVVLRVNDQQAVRLVPVTPEQPKHRVFGSAKGLIIMSDDFDAPLEEFREYME